MSLVRVQPGEPVFLMVIDVPTLPFPTAPHLGTLVLFCIGGNRLTAKLFDCLIRSISGDTVSF